MSVSSAAPRFPTLTSIAAQSVLDTFSREQFRSTGPDGREYLNITKLNEYATAANASNDGVFSREMGERIGKIVFDYLRKHNEELNNPDILKFHETFERLVVLPNETISLNMARYFSKYYPNQVFHIRIASRANLSIFVNTSQPLEFSLDLSIDPSASIDNDQLAEIVRLCPQLTGLNLKGCRQITDESLARLVNLTQLRDLNLEFLDQLTNAGLAHLANLTQLKDLNLSKCHQITDAGLTHLANLTQLKDLNLSNCHRITNAGLTHLANLTQLRDLNLKLLDQITDEGLARLVNLTQLTSLDLSGCISITDAGLAHLVTLTQLRVLHLSWCRITDAGLAHLVTLTQLRDLNLIWCHITDVGLAHLANLTRLRGLNLTQIYRITNTGVATLRANNPLLKIDR